MPDKMVIQINILYLHKNIHGWCLLEVPQHDTCTESRLAKKREILTFPRMAVNMGNSQEIQGISRKYWEINIYIDGTN